MIVPFLFGVEKDPIHYLWIFYKYMNFAIDNNYPIIAQEDYFELPSVVRKKREWVFGSIKDGVSTLYEFKEPTDNDMLNLKKYKITKQEEKLVFTKNSKYEILTDLLKNRNKKLEKLIQNKINEIQKNENKKIDAFLTWVGFPSLYYICKKNNIKVITQEQSTIRKPTYNTYLGFCSLENKYENKKCYKDYELFKKKCNYSKFFSRDELLALFLSTSNLKYIIDKNKSSEYEFGIDLGIYQDPYFDAYSQYTHKQLVKGCSKLVDDNDILGRTHPMRPSHEKCKIMDNSKNSIEWILKCKRVVTTVSNIGFETMLYGKTPYILSNFMPFNVGNPVCDLSHLDERITDTVFLNYMLFGYFAPFGLMFDKDYLMKQLDVNYTVVDRYEENLNFILKQYGLSYKIFNKNHQDRMKVILKKVHNYCEEDANKFINELYVDEKQQLLEENQQLKNELNRILNSKGWKLLEKIRKIKG